MYTLTYDCPSVGVLHGFKYGYSHSLKSKQSLLELLCCLSSLCSSRFPIPLFFIPPLPRGDDLYRAVTSSLLSGFHLSLASREVPSERHEPGAFSPPPPSRWCGALGCLLPSTEASAPTWCFCLCSLSIAGWSQSQYKLVVQTAESVLL